MKNRDAFAFDPLNSNFGFRYNKPREIVVVDLIGDERYDFVLLIHDRLLFNFQELAVESINFINRYFS